MEGERRRWKRYQLQSYPLAMVSKPASLICIFSNKIIDLSEGGIAFSYIGWEEWADRNYKLELLDEDFYLEGLGMTIVSDIPLDGNLSFRRCGARFEKLNFVQKRMLRAYLNKKSITNT